MYFLRKERCSLPPPCPPGLFKVALCLAAVLVVTRAEGRTIVNDIDHTVHNIENKTSEEIGDKFKTFFHDSRNKLYLAFYNLSSYLPLSIKYAETVGKECDVLEHNRRYYTTVGLILAGVLVVLGIIFAFFGEFHNIIVKTYL